MVSGIYIVRSNTGSAERGLVVVDSGKIHGGDMSYLYRGRFEENAGKVKAQIEIIHHSGPTNPVLGPTKRITLIFQGVSTAKGFTLQTVIPGKQGITVGIIGEKKEELAS